MGRGAIRVGVGGFGAPFCPHTPVNKIQVGPPGYFIHVSITTPAVSALKNYYRWSFLEVPTDILNHFWIQVAVSILKPPHGGFRSETAVK
jgi:hypothetical protein